jgi:hypothetical protein
LRGGERVERARPKKSEGLEGKTREQGLKGQDPCRNEVIEGIKVDETKCPSLHPAFLARCMFYIQVVVID